MSMADKGKMQFWFRIITGFLCALIFIIGVFWITMNNNMKNVKYPEMKTGDSIRDKVVSIEIERSFGRVIFESGLQRTIYFARNDSYTPIDLAFFLQKEDLFLKKGNNDTIMIIRDNVSFTFVLGKEIQCCK